jgi:hypothetical protein
MGDDERGAVLLQLAQTGRPPPTDDDRRAQELTEQTNETNVYDLMQTIRKEIPSTDE